MYGPLYPSFNLIAGINGNPSKLIVTLKGQAKSSQSSLAGIYTLEPKPINDKSHWLQNSGSNAIWWCEKDRWDIGPLGKTGDILSFDKSSSPLEATTWHYYNGKNYIASDDILVEAGSEAGKCILIQYQGKAKEISGNTVGYFLELSGLCPGQYLPPGRSP